MIYFDNAATTRALPAVAEKMSTMLCEQYGNPASVSAMGLAAEKEIRNAAEIIARGIHCKYDEVFFTSGGTEGDNWAIYGTAEGYKRQGQHFITTEIEHPAVKNPMKLLEEKGAEVTWLKVDRQGHISLEELANAIRPDTVLVSTILVNNETGTVQDAAAIGKLIKEKNPQCLYHVDAVQAFGQVPIDVEEMQIDLLSASGHKFGGPKGVGFLYIRKGVKIRPLIYGGAQEKKRRAGTENVPGIVGLGKAAEIAAETMESRARQETKLRDYLIDEVLRRVPYTRCNGSRDDRLPNNASFCFRFIEGESLLIMLDMKGICGSSGSACTSGSLDPSHVLMAWLPPARYEQLLEHYAYNNELGGTFSTMRTTAMGQARHIRECGFTYDVGQTMAGSVTISVPVFNHAGEIQAAIALSGLSRSLEPELACLVDGKPATASAQDMVQLVQTAGREVSRGLGYSGDYLGLNS